MSGSLKRRLRIALLVAVAVWLLFLILLQLRTAPSPHSTSRDWQWLLASHLRRSSLSPDAIDDSETDSSLTSQPLCIVGTAWTQRGVEAFMADFDNVPAMWAILTVPPAYAQTVEKTDVLSSFLAIRHTRLSFPDSGLPVAAKQFSIHYRGLRCQYFLLSEAIIRLELLRPDSSRWPTAADTLLGVLHGHKPTAVTLTHPASPKCRDGPLPLDDDERAVHPLIVHRTLMDFIFPMDVSGGWKFVGSHTATALLPAMYPQSTVSAATLLRTARLTTDCAMKAALAHHLSTSNYSSLASSSAALPQTSKSLRKRSVRAASNDNIAPAHSPHPATDYLLLLNDVVDILHPSIASNAWVGSHHTVDSLRSFRGSDCHPRLLLLVFTLNRLGSLKRLLQSVVKSDYSGWETVDLHIHIDHSDVQHEMRRYLSNFTWPFGGLLFRYENVTIGLRDSILSAWQPDTMDEFAVFLEDDIEVSPQFAVWVRVAVVSYYYSVSLPLRESPLMGVSLYVPTWSERVDQPFWMDPTFPVYGMQAPSSWGAVYFPYQWTSFRRWQKAHATADPLVPGLASINGWSMDKSWKKYLIRYMVEQGYYMLYPNRIDGLSFSTNHAEAGTNVYFSSEWKKVLDARFNVPLVPRNDSARWYQRHSAVLFGHMRVVDIFDRPAKLTAQQRITAVPVEAWRGYSGLTIAVPLDSSSSASKNAVVASLRYWQDLFVLQQLVVQVPAHLNFSCPPWLRVRCIVNHAEVGSVDTYLWPLPHPRSGSVLLLSPHLRLPLAAVEDMLHVWQRYPDQLVGLAELTRSYRMVDGRYVAWIEPLPQLTLLPGKAMLLASHYLDLYWSDERPFHSAVRQSAWWRGRGEDVALVRLIANVTGRWPVVLNRTINGSLYDLWHEPAHLYKDDLAVVRQCYGEEWPWLNGQTLEFNETAWGGQYRVPDNVLIGSEVTTVRAAVEQRRNQTEAAINSPSTQLVSASSTQPTQRLFSSTAVAPPPLPPTPSP